MGRNSGYSRNRDYRLPQDGLKDRNGGDIRGTGGSLDQMASRGQPQQDHPIKDNSDEVSGMVAGLEKRMSGVQQDFQSAIHKISEKENEKFDLIFAILSELQQRQAHLEESVRTLKAQYGGNGYMVPNGNVNAPNPMSQPQLQQQPQFGSCGPQYAWAVPQMMTPTGAIVQQMPAPMAMQFIVQGAGPEMNGQQCLTFMNGQDGSPSGAPVQGQMNVIQQAPVNLDGNGQQPMVWQSEAGSALASKQPQQDAAEVPSHHSAMSGVGSSETSSQEGKLEDCAA